MAAAVVAIVATLLAPHANRAQEGRAVTRETIATLSVAELEKLAEQQKELLGKEQLSTAERARALTTQILVSRRLMQFRQALEAGIAYHQLVTRNGRNTDVLKSTLSMAEDLTSLGEMEKAEQLIEQTLRGFHGGPLDPIFALTARMKLAAYAEQLGRKETAAERWREVKLSAEAALKLIESRVLPASQRSFCEMALATALAATGELRQAVDLLADRLQEHVEQQQYAQAEETAVEIARHLVLLKQYEEAAKHLTLAIEWRQQHRANDTGARAELLLRLAAVEQSAGQAQLAREHTAAAISLLEQALPRQVSGAVDSLNAARWQLLRDAYRHAGRYEEALRVALAVAEFYQRRLGEEHRTAQASRGAAGALYGATGRYRAAVTLLLEQAEVLRSSPRPVPLELAATLMNLGAAQQAVGEYLAARRHFDQALELRRLALPHDDLQLAASLGAVASLDVAEGKFAQAIATYEQAVTICRKHSSHPEALSATLLNLAVAYKSQHQFAKAIELCRESLELRMEAAETSQIELAASYNALAALYRIRGNQFRRNEEPAKAARDYEEAIRLAKLAWNACQQSGGEHAEAAGALNQLASIVQLLGDDALAEEYWRKSLAIYERLENGPMAAQVHNALGVSEYGRNEFASAGQHFEQALALQKHDAFRPQVRYSTLCNLAHVRDRQGKREQAIELLTQAVEIIEAPRAGYLGDERQLARFFAEFGHAFDLLFAWHIEAGRLDEAFQIAERSRNRTLLDRMQLAGIDLRDTLSGPQGEALRRQEAQGRQQLNELRSRAEQTVLSPAERQQLEAEYLAAQQNYADTWNTIRNASPVYRQLLAGDREQLSLDALRGTLAADDGMLLMYHVGVDRSYLLVIDGQLPPRAFPLMLHAATPSEAELAAPGQGANDTASRGEGEPFADSLLDDLAQRGLIGRVATEKGERAASLPVAARGPLTRRGAELLVGSFRRQLESQSPTAGNHGAGQVLGGTLLPAELLQLIEQRQPSYLMVLRDDALHALPWEALPAGDRLALDLLPPIAYAPSASVLANLIARRGNAPRPEAAAATLLSVGNPAYSDRTEIGFGAKLPRLPGTTEECRQIADCFRNVFGTESVTLLEGDRATEEAFLTHTAGKRFIHLAAHGLLDERHDNLFGAIALAQPAAGSLTTSNDGFLEVREIQSLPLSACELAILSACQTNVGAKRPLEAGPSLAQAFLLGGATRVAASHWSVSDSSTAELMSIYMRQMLDQAERGEAIDYAAALQSAKRQIRQQSQWAAPYHWSAFVLVGPAR